MSDILTIRRAIGAKVAQIAGIKKVYDLEPDAVPDGPVATVLYEGTDVILASQFEELEHTYVVHVYQPGASPAVSEQVLLPMVALVLAEFRTGKTLGGLVVECAVVRVEALEDLQDVNGREYARLPFRLRVRDAGVVTVGI